jgi:tetratricopeptide (TPR) repeat protein
MGRKHFNWKIAMVLLLGVGIVAGTVAGLHYIQKTGRYEEYYTLGMESFEQGQWEDAAEHLGKYITNDRQNVDVLHKYAQAQLNIRPSKSGNIQQAKGAFRDILRIESGDRAAARQLVEMYLQTGEIGEAYLRAQRFLQERRDADVECLLAEAMIFRREYVDAYELLQSVVEEEPNQIRAYERLAAITVDRADEFELPAVHWLDLSIRNNPESASAYLARARFNLMQKERANAIQDLKTALTKTLSDPEEHMTVAVLYRALGQMDSVNEQLDAIQSLQPDHLPMWIFRAGIALASQDKAQMRQVADDSLAYLRENKWDFYALATELYVRAETFDEAKTCLSTLKKQDSRPAEVVYLEGLLALQQDRVQEAVQKWKRAAGLHYQGPSPYVQLYLGFKPVPLKLLLASAQMQLGDTISARQLFDSLASGNADNLSVQFALARYMVQSGDWAQARNHAQKILRSDPNNAEATLLTLEAEIKLLALEGLSATSNQWKGLEQRLTQLSVSAEDAVSISLLRFQMALSRSDLDVAESILESMSPIGSVDQQKVIVAWVNLLMAQNRTDEILGRLRTASNQHGQSEQMVRLLAYFLSKAGDYDAAEQVLVDGMSRMNAPSSSLRLGYMLSDLLTQWGKEDEKVALLEHLDQQYPDTIAVQRLLLQCPRIVGSREKAQALVNKIRTFEGEEGWQWRYEQAKLWFGQDDFQNKYSETVSLLQQNLRSNGNDQASRRMLAASHSKAGQSSQALATYQDALNREPYNLSIVIPVVRALQAAKKFDEADDILKRVANKELTDPSLDKLQVYSYLQQGQVGSAATLMESYLKDDPNNVGIALVLAKLKIGQKEYDVAKVMLDEIKENTPDDSIMFKVEQLEVQVLMQQGLSEQNLRRESSFRTQSRKRDCDE